MSEQNFPVALKSTVDKIGYDLAQAESPAVEFVDLDNVVNTTALLKTDDTALIWSMGLLVPTPRDPLYSVSFHIGARTVNDPANYDIMLLVGKLKEVFNVDSFVDIHDYTGVSVGPKLGVLRISRVAVMPQEFDKVSGIRMISLEAKAQRTG